MNKKLDIFLKATFDLTDEEYSEILTKDDIANWDSLKHMVLVTSLEREFNIILDVQEIVNMQSFPDIIQILKEKEIDLDE